MNEYHVRIGGTHMLVVYADYVTISDGILCFWVDGEDNRMTASFAPGMWASFIFAGEVEAEEDK